MVLLRRNVDKFEVEKEDGGNLPVDCCIGLEVRVVKHTTNI
jgi:hypothetical protein